MAELTRQRGFFGEDTPRPRSGNAQIAGVPLLVTILPTPTIARIDLGQQVFAVAKSSHDLQRWAGSRYIDGQLAPMAGAIPAKESESPPPTLW